MPGQAAGSSRPAAAGAAGWRSSGRFETRPGKKNWLTQRPWNDSPSCGSAGPSVVNRRRRYTRANGRRPCKVVWGDAPGGEPLGHLRVKVDVDSPRSTCLAFRTLDVAAEVAARAVEGPLDLPFDRLKMLLPGQVHGQPQFYAVEIAVARQEAQHLPQGLSGFVHQVLVRHHPHLI